MGSPLGGVGATLNAERLAAVLGQAQARGRAPEESNQVRISQVRMLLISCSKSHELGEGGGSGEEHDDAENEGLPISGNVGCPLRCTAKRKAKPRTQNSSPYPGPRRLTH